MSAGTEAETLRWPTNLDREAIEKRLGIVASKAAELQIREIYQRLDDVQSMPPAQIASNMIACLTWIFNQPSEQRAAYEALTKDLEMVALNLKNLK